jgi:phage terminase Nu1 subunit (DNA packaging protein)
MDRFGESHKQIERYVGEGMPCDGVGRDRRFPWPECRNWRDERIRKQERDKAEKDVPADIEKARARKMDAEAREAELRVEKMLGAVVPLEMVEEAVGAVCDAILPVLQNIPSNYGLRLEELGVSAADAERVLESIATEITVSMQQTADSHEAAVDDEESDDSASDRRIA